MSAAVEFGNVLPEDHWPAAACVGLDDPDVMFPERFSRAQNDRAKRVCRRCPVIDACRDHALATGELFGVWGGMGELERHRELRRRGLHVVQL